MNKELIKCSCGKELEEYDTRFVTNPITQEFVCRECWKACKEKRHVEVDVCCKCGKALQGKSFIDHRFTLAPDRKGKTGFNLFCISCEPYSEMTERH